MATKDTRQEFVDFIWMRKPGGEAVQVDADSTTVRAHLRQGYTQVRAEKLAADKPAAAKAAEKKE